MRLARRLVAILALSLAVVLPGVGWADSSPPTPGGSVTKPTDGGTYLTSTGGYSLPVQWSATCGENYWAVNVFIAHQDGSKANGAGYVFDASSSTNSQDMTWEIQMLPQLQKETFQVRVSLECPNGSTDRVIGTKTVTLVRSKATPSRCDPALLRKSANEYARADILSGEADAKLYKSQGEWEQWIADEEKEFVKISLEKPTILEVIKGTAKDAGYQKVADKLVHVFEVDIGPVLTAYWVASDIEPHILSHDADLNEVQQLDDQANHLYKQALADFKAALEQEPACQDQAKAQRAKEDLAQKKRDLIEMWDQNKYGHYWNPTRQEWEEERAALQAAEQILTDPRKLQATDATPHIPKPRKVRISVAQAKAALVYIDKGLKLHRSALTRERQALTLTTTFATSMRRLLNES